jgi:hypothetical protein
VYTASHTSGPFALLLSLDRKFVNTLHTGTEYAVVHTKTCPYLGNEFTVDHYRRMADRYLQSLSLIHALYSTLNYVFSLSSYISEKTACVSYEDYLRIDFLCVGLCLDVYVKRRSKECNLYTPEDGARTCTEIRRGFKMTFYMFYVLIIYTFYVHLLVIYDVCVSYSSF